MLIKKSKNIFIYKIKKYFDTLQIEGCHTIPFLKCYITITITRLVFSCYLNYIKVNVYKHTMCAGKDISSYIGHFNNVPFIKKQTA